MQTFFYAIFTPQYSCLYLIDTYKSNRTEPKGHFSKDEQSVITKQIPDVFKLCCINPVTSGRVIRRCCLLPAGTHLLYSRECASLIPPNKFKPLHFLDFWARNVYSSIGIGFQAHMSKPRTIV